MKLIAKARPVRIRIVSGGKEHSNIESLRQHYCFKDLLESAIDGRLSNWLKQKNQLRIAKGIDDLKEDLASETIAERIYIRFSCLCLGIAERSASMDQEQLFEDWPDKYLGSPEYACVKKEATRIRMIRSHKEDGIRMRSDFEFAVKMYKEQKESRNAEEWISIMSNHVESNARDVDLNWIMYSLTSEPKYLKHSAEAGHPEAIILFKKTENRFYGVSKPDFKLILTRLNVFTDKRNLDQAIEEIKSVSVHSQEDIVLRDELISIIKDFGNRFDIMYSGEGFNAPVIPNIHILKNELEFYKGMIAEVNKKDIAYDYYTQIGDSYIPAKMRLDMLNTNKVKWSNVNLSVTKLKAGEQTLGEAILHFDYLYYDRDRIAIILRFILVHMFDTFTYEVR